MATGDKSATDFILLVENRVLSEIKVMMFELDREIVERYVQEQRLKWAGTRQN